jgi:hypothetical protein
MHPSTDSEVKRFGSVDWPAAAGAQIGRHTFAVPHVPTNLHRALCKPARPRRQDAAYPIE